MKIDELFEFCQKCPFCQNPMPLYFKYLRLERDISIHDDICSLLVSGVGKLEINISKNTWYTSTAGGTTHTNLNNRHFVLGRKCTCGGQTCWQSSCLVFNEDRTLAPIEIDTLMFQQVVGEERLVITSNYKEGYTSLTKYEWSKFFSRNKNYYKQFPLVNFDFSSREKVEGKLRMIMTFL